MTPADLPTTVAARWSRLGAMFNIHPSRETPDLERLLLDTARAAPANTRLFVLAATWLARYGEYVARHRLARLVRDELGPAADRPTLGFLLEWAQQHGGKTNTARFDLAIKACRPARDPGPLADVERANPAFARLARRRASALSLKWGRWFTDFDPKTDALRPPEWVAAHNPPLAERALTGGDLVASVIAECQADPRPIASESELARRCGASRPATRDALRRLRLAGRVHTTDHGRSTVIRLVRTDVA